MASGTRSQTTRPLQRLRRRPRREPQGRPIVHIGQSLLPVDRNERVGHPLKHLGQPTVHHVPLALQPIACRNIDSESQLRVTPLEFDGAARQLHLDQVSVLAPVQPALQAFSRSLARTRLLAIEVLVEIHQLRRRLEPFQRHLQKLLPAEAVLEHCGRVDVQEAAAFSVKHPHRQGADLEHLAIATFAALQGFPHVDHLGHIPRNAVDTQDARVVPQRALDRVKDRRSSNGAQRVFALDRFGLPHHVLVIRPQLGCLVGRKDNRVVPAQHLIGHFPRQLFGGPVEHEVASFRVLGKDGVAGTVHQVAQQQCRPRLPLNRPQLPLGRLAHLAVHPAQQHIEQDRGHRNEEPALPGLRRSHVRKGQELVDRLVREQDPQQRRRQVGEDDAQERTKVFCVSHVQPRKVSLLHP